MDVLLLAVGDQLVTLEERVALNLVDSGDDTGAPDQGFDLWQSAKSSVDRRSPYLLNRVVGNTNGAGLALGQLGHGCSVSIYIPRPAYIPFQVSTIEMLLSRTTSPPSTVLPSIRGK